MRGLCCCTNPFEDLARAAKAQALIDLLDRYGWGDDLELLERMQDAHWEVVTGLARFHYGKNFGVPSAKTRRMVIERVRLRQRVAVA